MTLRVRWLGRVPYREAHALQQGLFHESADDHLLLLEHPHVYTLGVRADLANVLVPPAEVGADLVRTDRGGDVTYHGPGQLVGYPILSLPGKRGGSGMADTVAYVNAVEQLVIDALGDLGVTAARLDGYPGVWIEDRKVCAIGVKLTRGRSMHGFALNVEPDLAMFDHIVPCGIGDKAVTSLRAEGVAASMREVVDAVSARAVERWGRGAGGADRQDVAWSRGPAPAGLALAARKPPWVRANLALGEQALGLKHTMRDLGLVTVCEEAGCPNLSECWSDGTATFMINGERCTRACAFCLVDTSRPLPIAPDEPARVAEAVARMGLQHAVVTAVARDDVADGGAAAFADTILA
ncbi:MAG: lipoyl(octanoyl) transferase LipB, partial [Acidimicrobiia bacterium]